MPRAVLFNGKFLNAPAKGLSRMANEMIGQVDEILAESAGFAQVPSWGLACRRDARLRAPLRKVALTPGGLFNWDGWEQFDLPRMAQGKLLVNLCNMAPLSVRGSIVTIHDAHVFLMPESHTPSYAAWYRFALPRVAAAASRVLTVSAFSRDSLVEHGVAPSEKITVIPNGGDHLLRVEADASVVRRLGLTEKGYALALANPQKHKNIAVLLRAFALPAMADLKLVLVGPADSAAFAKAGLVAGRNVLFAGPVADKELRGLYESAACLAFPSLLEGFGLPPVEAMSLGCPVFAAPRGAIPEVCADAAHYCDPHDEQAWAEAIAGFAGDGAIRRDAAARGRVRAAAFRWRDSAGRLMQVIAEQNG